MKAVKLVKKVDPVAKADELGKDYVDTNNRVKMLGNKLSEIKLGVTDLADTHGQKTGKETIVRGSKFEVGFLDVEDSKSVDIEKARKILTPLTFQKILTETVDEAKVEQLVNEGKIKADDLIKMLTVTRKGGRRIVVRPII